MKTSNSFFILLKIDLNLTPFWYGLTLVHINNSSWNLLDFLPTLYSYKYEWMFFHLSKNVPLSWAITIYLLKVDMLRIVIWHTFWEIEPKWNKNLILNPPLGTIHWKRQHVLGGEGCQNVPMVNRSQYIRIKNPLHKHFAGMPMVGG